MSTFISEIISMRYPPEYKAAARARLIESSGALAKQKGFSSTGMDALAAAAGVTTGAFYSQFKSKSDLLYAIVDHELSRTVTAFEGKTGTDLEKVTQWYLSPKHAAHPETGCPIPSLGAEIARADDATRQHFENLLKQIVETLQHTTKTDEIAWQLLAQAVGAIMLSRAVINPETQLTILKAAQQGILSHITSSESDC